MHERPAERPTGPAPDEDARIALRAADVAARLRPVCTGWDEERFQHLVRQVTRVKIRWGETYRGHPPP